MKFHSSFQTRLGLKEPHEAFDYLISTLTDSITGWSYFVNWNKVNLNSKKSLRLLNLLNSLVGHPNPEQELRELLQEYPDVAILFPVLVAYRFKPKEKSSLRILKEYKQGFSYEVYDFSKRQSLSIEQIDSIVDFASQSGFLEQLKNQNIRSLPDYFFGVEVGLDSNGRKNRGGTAMEELVEHFISEICHKHGYEFITQATAPLIEKKWGKFITVEKSYRKIDFAINTPHKLYLIETNFYSGGGSKLKSTAGEYKSDYRRWKSDGHEFIWITDGAGWRDTQRPLEETFNETDYILNLDMLTKGVLSDIISQ